MQEIGRLLKAKRTELGLSLIDIEQRTKIRNRYLEAIEDGDWSVMPGDVYARGFVRAYAEAVGLDGNDLLRNAPDSGPSEQPKEPVQPMMQPPVEKMRPRTAPVRKRPAASASRANRVSSAGPRGGIHAGQIAFVIVILVLLGLGWWLLAKPTHHNNSGSKQPGQGAANNTTMQNQTGANTAAGNQNNSAPANNTTAPTTPTVQITPSTQPTGDVTYTVTSSPAQPLATTLATSSGQLWVQLTIDGVNQGAGGVMLQANSKKTWNAQKSLIIRMGNVSGVTLTIDGQAVTLPNVNHPINVTIATH